MTRLPIDLQHEYHAAPVNPKEAAIRAPVGISNPGMTSSEMPSIIFTMARIELPWAATNTVFPACGAGMEQWL